MIRGLDDGGEVNGLEGSAADEAAVDIGLGQQLGGVLGVHAAAVKDADGTGGTGAVDAADDGTDALADFLRLLGRRGPAGPGRLGAGRLHAKKAGNIQRIFPAFGAGDLCPIL